MKRLHEIGRRLDALLNQAGFSTPEEWAKSPAPGLACWHLQLCACCASWLEEFHAVEKVLERLPDGWAEMAGVCDLENIGRDPFGPENDPHWELALSLSRHGDAVRLARVWQPLWAKLLPAVRSGVGMPKAPVVVASEWERIASDFISNAGKPGYRVDLLDLKSVDGNFDRIKNNVNEALERFGSLIRVGVRRNTLQEVKPRPKKLKEKPTQKSRKQRRS